MLRTTLLALALVIAVGPAFAQDCEPGAGAGDPGVNEDSTVTLGPPPNGGTGQNPQAPATTSSGTTPARPTTNEGGIVTSPMPKPPTITGGTQEPSNDPKVKITKGGTTTFPANPETTITGGVTRADGAPAASQGGTTRNIGGTFTNTGGTVSVKTNDDNTVVVTISGGTNKFTGGSNIDGSAVPIDPATGAPPAPVTVNPQPADSSVSVNYQSAAR